MDSVLIKTDGGRSDVYFLKLQDNQSLKQCIYQKTIFFLLLKVAPTIY